MNCRPLGKTGISVSELAFGAVEIGLPYGVHKRLMFEGEAIGILRSAFEQGINFFDTARMYGCSEERIGKAFKGMRDKIVISSKCPNFRDENKRLRTGKSLKTFIDDSVTQSLRNLNTDYLDAYLAHRIDDEILACDDVIDALTSLKTKGCVRSFGASIYGYSQLKQIIESGRWDVAQFAFNLMDQSAAQLFQLARSSGIGLVVRSVLMKGILTDSVTELTHEKLQKVNEHRKIILDFCKKLNMPVSDVATKFVLSHADISAALVGIDKPEYLQKAIDLADGKYFENELLTQLQRLAYTEPEFLDLGVWDRNGWY